MCIALHSWNRKCLWFEKSITYYKKIAVRGTWKWSHKENKNDKWKTWGLILNDNVLDNQQEPHLKIHPKKLLGSLLARQKVSIAGGQVRVRIWYPLITRGRIPWKIYRILFSSMEVYFVLKVNLYFLLLCFVHFVFFTQTYCFEYVLCTLLYCYLVQYCQY